MLTLETPPINDEQASFHRKLHHVKDNKGECEWQHVNVSELYNLKRIDCNFLSILSPLYLICVPQGAALGSCIFTLPPALAIILNNGL